MQNFNGQNSDRQNGDNTCQPLSSEDWERYKRQMRLPLVGQEGQLKLKNARVLLVGLGGLGSPAALYLAAAGVGTLGLADHDTVEVSNLHRQVLYTPQDLNILKVQAAEKRLKDMVPSIQTTIHPEGLTSENTLSIIERYDLILDGSDNFKTRYMVNDGSFFKKKPYLFASVDRFMTQLSFFNLPGGPCYRCLYPDLPSPENFPNCAEVGVLGVVPGLAGILQANEAIKFILQAPSSLKGKVFCLDLLDMNWKFYHLSPNPDCVLCGKNPQICDWETAKKNWPKSQLQSQSPDKEQNHRQHMQEITPQELKQMQEQQQDFFLLDVRTPEESLLASIGGYLLPIDELPERIEELRPYQDKDIVIYCHHGMRSRQCCYFLLSHGFTKVKNLRGGIEYWSSTVDPSVPHY